MKGWHRFVCMTQCALNLQFLNQPQPHPTKNLPDSHLKNDVLASAVGHDLPPLEKGVQLDLIDGRHDLRGKKQLLQVRNAEIGDADGPQAAQRLVPLQHPPGLGPQRRVARGVQQEEVDVVQTQFLECRKKE